MEDVTTELTQEFTEFNQKFIELTVNDYAALLRLKHLLRVYNYTISQESLRSVEELIAANYRGKFSVNICGSQTDEVLKRIITSFEDIENLIFHGHSLIS